MTTWSPTDKNANIALSGGNLIATGTVAADSAARATLSRSSGKFYFEVTVTTVAASSNVSGIAKSTASLANAAYLGSDANGYGYAASGNVLNGGAAVASYATLASGNVVGVAVDLTALKIWWAKNGVWQSGDPNTGTGGVSISSGAYFPALSLANTAVSTANFGASATSFTVPTGFQTWDVSYSLAAATGAFALTGNASTLGYSRKLLGATGAFALTGSAAQFAIGQNYRLSAGLGSFALTGNAATLSLPFWRKAVTTPSTWTSGSSGSDPWSPVTIPPQPWSPT